MVALTVKKKRTSAQNLRWCKKKNQVRELRGVVCELCGGEFGHLEVHHLLPRRGGGLDVWWNLQLVCGDCHDRTHNRPLRSASLNAS